MAHFLTDRERRYLDKALTTPQDDPNTKEAAWARELLATVMQKAYGALADLAWLALHLPPERVRKLMTAGDRNLPYVERIVMEAVDKVGREEAGAPYGRPGETFAMRCAGAIQGGLLPRPHERGPTMRVVIVTGYEDSEAVYYLPSGRFSRIPKRFNPRKVPHTKRSGTSRSATGHGPEVS